MIEGRNFSNQEVQLDELKFVNCTFVNCRMIYAGGNFHLEGCQIHSGSFVFAGPAANTLRVLALMYRDMGGENLVNSFLQQIRSGLLNTEDEIEISSN
jgi:hypothetical protein